MGQLISSDASNQLKQLEQQYTYVRPIVQDARYGDGKLYQAKSDQRLQIVYKSIDIAQHAQQQEYWNKKLQEHSNLKHPNIIELKSFQIQEEEQMCSSYYRVHLIFEYLPNTLKDVIESRRKQGTYFQEEELMSILRGAVNGLAKFQEMKIAHQNLRLNTISYNNDTIKICDTPLLTNLTCFSAMIQDYSGQMKGYYLSPLLTKAVRDNNHQPQHNSYKSDVYALGMNMLHMTNLKPCDHCYRFDQGIIEEEQIRILLDDARYNYSSQWVDRIEEMLQQQENNRPDFRQLKDELERNQSNYYQIEQHFKPQQVNQQAPMMYESHHEELKDTKEVAQSSGLMELQIDEPDHVEGCYESQPAQPSKFDILINNEKQQTRNSEQKNLLRYFQQQESLEQEQQNHQQQQQQQQQYQPQSQQQQQQQIPKQDAFTTTSQFDPYQLQQQQQQQQQQQLESHNRQDAYTQYSKIYDSVVQPSKYDSIQPQKYESVKPQQYNSQQPKYEPIQPQQQIEERESDPYADFAKYSITNLYPQYQEQQPATTFNNNNTYQPYQFTQQSQQYSRPSYEESKQSYQYTQPPPKTYQTPQILSTQQPPQSFSQPPIQPASHYPQYQSYMLPQLDRTSQFGNKLNQATYVNELLPTGERYVGEKVNGKRQGNGRIYYQDGGYYDGQWKNDLINGQGILYYASGRPAYDGQWINDKFQGRGILYNDSPTYGEINYRNLDDLFDAWTKYVGSFNDDAKEGDGVIYFLNGDRFEGQFHNDLADGYGRFIKQNGQLVQGMWRQNMYIGQ